VLGRLRKVATLESNGAHLSLLDIQNRTAKALCMVEYKITRQAVDMEWAVVPGAPTREIELHPPAGEEWTLHSFEHSSAQVVAVWEREKRAHPMSEIYSHTNEDLGTVKTVADMPAPK